jgi:two-component sensor histidine kinase
MPMSLDPVQTSQLKSTHLAVEANHRIANHLAMLATLMRMHGKSIGGMPEPMSGEDVQLVLEEFAGRLDTVGTVHRLLADGSIGAPIDVAEYLRTIAQGLVSSLTAHGETTLEYVFPVTCVLPAEQAVALGFLIGELIANAVKYAHPARVRGAIRIEASKRDDDTIAIEVCDDGVGLPEDVDPLQSHSLGFRMIRMLAKQLGASISFDNYGLGLCCVLQIPYTARALQAVS